MHERIKLALMLVITAVTAPLLWLAFVDAVAGTSLIAHETPNPTPVPLDRSYFMLAVLPCLVLAAAAWAQFVAVLRRREQTTTEVAAYISEGDWVLGTHLGATTTARLPTFVTAILVVWAAIGLVGIVGACVVFGWRF